MNKGILSILVLATNGVLAQSSQSRSFTQGYIVQQNGDTLKGNMAMLSEEESCAHIDFKKNNLDTVTVFTSDNVQLYKRENSVYVSKRVTDKKTAFVKSIEKGRINLYRYSYVYTKFGAAGEKTIDKSGPVEIQHTSKPIDITYDYYLEKPGGDFKKITRQNQKGELWTFFKGDDEMVKKIKNTKIEYDEIPALIKEYNTSHK